MLLKNSTQKKYIQLGRFQTKLVLFWTLHKNPPLSSCVKNKMSFELKLNLFDSFYVRFLIILIKNIRQNLQENIVQSLFYKTSIKMLHLIRKTPPNTFAYLAAKFWYWFRKTNTVIYYLINHWKKMIIRNIQALCVDVWIIEKGSQH